MSLGNASLVDTSDDTKLFISNDFSRMATIEGVGTKGLVMTAAVKQMTGYEEH
jgi:hypothetical protein